MKLLTKQRACALVPGEKDASGQSLVGLAALAKNDIWAVGFYGGYDTAET
jgi:hypothetical protein